MLVADTSGLVSLGISAGSSPDLLALCFEVYDVVVPEIVVEELQDIAEYDDTHGGSARAVLEQTDESNVRTVTLDTSFPLDDGENAAVTLANDAGASLFLCDEFNRLGIVHASLVTARLVTTPTLLAVFVESGHLDTVDALALLDEITAARSWDSNSYVRRARSLFE
jgi:predicted nucleic acid-binding protein